MACGATVRFSGDEVKIPETHVFTLANVRRNVSKSQHKRRGRKGKKRNPTAKGVDGHTWSALANGLPFMQGPFPDNAPYNFVQTSESDTALTTSNVGLTTYSTYFTLGSSPQSAQFAAVFDQYRLMEVQVWFVPVNPTSPSGAAVNRGMLYSVVDYDNITALGSAAAAQSYTNCVSSPCTVAHYRRFTPHMAVGAYSGTFTSYANLQRQWIDCTSNAVQHYGLKIIATQCDAAADAVVYNAVFRIWYQFRNVA